MNLLNHLNGSIFQKKEVPNIKQKTHDAHALRNMAVNIINEESGHYKQMFAVYYYGIDNNDEFNKFIAGKSSTIIVRVYSVSFLNKYNPKDKQNVIKIINRIKHKLSQLEKYYKGFSFIFSDYNMIQSNCESPQGTIILGYDD